MTLETAERELAALQTDHQAKLQAIMRRNGSTQDLIDQLIRNAEESILLEYKLRNE